VRIVFHRVGVRIAVDVTYSVRRIRFRIRCRSDRGIYCVEVVGRQRVKATTVPGTAIAAAPAYVLRQLEPGGPWFVVDRAGRSRLRDRNNVPLPRPGIGLSLEAMLNSAQVRTEYCDRTHGGAVLRARERGEPLPPPLWIMFVAVEHAALDRYLIGVVQPAPRRL